MVVSQMYFVIGNFHDVLCWLHDDSFDRMISQMEQGDELKHTFFFDYGIDLVLIEHFYKVP